MVKSDKRACSGCGLCAECCPVNAIKMLPDDDGFLYPQINKELCTGCGLCEKICPFYPEFTINGKSEPDETYIARSKSGAVLKKSASGGLFTGLSDAIIKSGGTVYGAAFDENFSVRHIRGTSSGERDRMCGSKYVQSTLSSVYESAADDLRAGKRVLFTGTPCQIAAVYRYLKQKKVSVDTLYTCDIICHAVTSPLLFEKYLDFIKAHYGNGIRSINMRDKDYGSGYNMTIITENGKYHKPEITDPFIKIFTLNCAMRPSCTACAMKKTDRMGDITIGDFQRERRFFPEYDDGKGVSVVWVNSRKGSRLFDEISANLDFKKCTVEQSLQHNLHGQIPPSPKTAEFSKDLREKNTESVFRKYTEYGFINRVYGESRRLAKKIIYGILGKPVR